MSPRASDRRFLQSFLEELLATPSVSGNCSRALDLIASTLSSFGVAECSRSRRESLLATIPGGRGGALLLCAHVDTLGAMIRSIGPDGVLRLKQVGGYAPNSVEGEYCHVETFDGTQIGGTIVFDRTSVHIYGSEKASCERTMDEMRLRLDEKLSGAEDAGKLGVSVGNYVHFEPRTVFTDSGYVKSRHLDDKAGVAVIVTMARALLRRGAKPRRTIHMLFTGFEEVGHGASLPIPGDVTDLIAVDVGIVGEGQSSREDAVTICTADATGPFSYGLVRRIAAVAGDIGIPFELDTFQRYGSDTMAALRTGIDARHALLGPAVDGSHALERTHMEGVMATLDLLIGLARMGLEP